MIALGQGRRLAIVAGSGSLPQEIVGHAKARGWTVLVLALQGFAREPFVGAESRKVSMLRPTLALQALRDSAADAVVLAGGVHKPRIGAVVTAWQAIRHREELHGLMQGGDDTLLRGVVRSIEAAGVPVVGIGDVAPELLAGEGALTARQPDQGAWSEIRLGLSALSALGPHDVGQALTVSQGRILSIEAAEGTDAAIRRLALLRRPGPIARVLRRGRPALSDRCGGVLVKAAKPEQDHRIDLPTIGPRTVRAAARARLSGVAVEAGAVLVLDRAQTIAEAERLGLFLVGVAR